MLKDLDGGTLPTSHHLQPCKQAVGHSQPSQAMLDRACCCCWSNSCKYQPRFPPSQPHANLTPASCAQTLDTILQRPHDPPHLHTHQRSHQTPASLRGTPPATPCSNGPPGSHTPPSRGPPSPSPGLRAMVGCSAPCTACCLDPGPAPLARLRTICSEEAGKLAPALGSGMLAVAHSALAPLHPPQCWVLGLGFWV